jgi:hypothetical protein
MSTHFIGICSFSTFQPKFVKIKKKKKEANCPNFPVFPFPEKILENGEIPEISSYFRFFFHLMEVYVKQVDYNLGISSVFKLPSMLSLRFWSISFTANCFSHFLPSISFRRRNRTRMSGSLAKMRKGKITKEPAVQIQRALRQQTQRPPGRIQAVSLYTLLNCSNILIGFFSHSLRVFHNF